MVLHNVKAGLVYKRSFTLFIYLLIFQGVVVLCRLQESFLPPGQNKL